MTELKLLGQSFEIPSERLERMLVNTLEMKEYRRAGLIIDKNDEYILKLDEEMTLLSHHR